MKRLLLICLSLVVSGCVTTVSPRAMPSQAQRGLPADYFDSRQGCFDAWAEILDSWVKATGGVRGSLHETRRITAADGTSVLSRIMQRVWVLQARGGASDDRSIVLQFSEALEDVAPDAVPDECATIVWLQPLLIERSKAFTEGAEEELRSAAPPEALQDSRSFSNWLLMQMLTRSPDRSAYIQARPGNP